MGSTSRIKVVQQKLIILATKREVVLATFFVSAKKNRTVLYVELRGSVGFEELKLADTVVTFPIARHKSFKNMLNF